MKKKSVKIAVALLTLAFVGLFAWYAQACEGEDHYGDEYLTLLFALSEKGTPQEVENAIKNVPNVNARKYRDGGPTPLMVAVQYNPNPEVITALIKAGAYISAIEQLELAAENPNPAVITTLIKAGADVNERDYFGMTSLILAARHTTHPEVITTILKLGGDPKVKDNEGKMAIDYARENPRLQNTEALRQLEQASRL